MGRLDGKVAVVTGGCSGIGLATVERFVQEGARVLVADVREDAGRQVVAGLGDAVRFRRCDVTQDAEIAAAMREAADIWGGLDIVFNNAGAGGTRAPIDEITAAEWDATQALLLRSVALGIRHAATHMKARGGGAIVNTASVAGLQAGYSPIAYAVAKAGVIHLTKVAAAELARHQIRVNAICPGFIMTNIFAAGIGIAGEAAERVKTALTGMAPRIQPVSVPGSPGHIADACVFLASDEAAFVTGTHLVVDGGLTVGPRNAWDPDMPSPIREVIAAAVRG
ncbi:MAG TPA: glucose 1-dehydrogenase [Acetobacteraceae bacterium]|nr:glucose 1-dehydrogenase [Acetobacteraceae bacterium]